MAETKNSNIIVRKATALDAKFLWVLRNNPTVYKFSRNSNPVEWDEHIDWLMPIIENRSNKRLFIIEVENEKAGQIRFDSMGNGEFEISISIAQNLRGRGVAKQGYLLALSLLKKERPVKKVIAEIHKDNEVSIKFFKKLGFGLKDQTDVWLTYIWQK